MRKLVQLPVSQGNMLLRWHLQVQQLNAAVPVQYYTTTRRGQQVQIPYQPKAVTANVKATGERLIKDYIAFCEGLFTKVGVNAFLDSEGNRQLPSLFTTSVDIGSRRSLSDRQAREHVRKLQKVGLVSFYKWHGSRAKYEIKIDENVLFGPHQASFWELLGITQKSVDNPVSQTAVPQFSPAQTELSSAYQVTVTYSIPETETYKCGNQHGDEKKRCFFSKHGDKHGDPERPQQGQLTERQASAPQAGRHGEGAPGGARAVDKSVGNVPGAGARLKAKLTGTKKPQPDLTAQRRAIMIDSCVRSFWAYARQKLYTSRRWADAEERFILNSIYKGVYGCFGALWTDREWDNYQKTLYRRIDMVAAYYQRRTDKWIPEPYARYQAGTGYFDAENRRGFANTLTWLQENQRHYRQSYVAQQVTRAIKYLQQHPLGRAPKRLQQKSYIEAFLYLEARMKAYGEGPLRRFYELTVATGVAIRPGNHL